MTTRARVRGAFFVTSVASGVAFPVAGFASRFTRRAAEFASRIACPIAGVASRVVFLLSGLASVPAFPVTVQVMGVASLAVVGVASPATADELPIADAHIHYSQPDWAPIPPEEALAILERAGVRRALVSSTPDDGTLKLYERAPDRIVPFLRPYRTREDMGGWSRDPGVQSYVEQRLARGIYKGIGEFHLSASDVEGPVVKRFAELAAARQLFLHAHVDAATVEKMLQLYPGPRILWAHAGMSAPATTVGGLLDRFPLLWVELSMRSDVAPGGTLDPEWRAVFLRHPDRFLVGTDTWVTSRWHSLADGMRQTRAWLGQLPRDAAEKIAYKNAERLFGPP
jgi:Amidohydrolase